MKRVRVVDEEIDVLGKPEQKRRKISVDEELPVPQKLKKSGSSGKLIIKLNTSSAVPKMSNPLAYHPSQVKFEAVPKGSRFLEPKKKRKSREYDDSEFVPMYGEPLYEDDFFLEGQSFSTGRAAIKKERKKNKRIHDSKIGVGSDGKMISKKRMNSGMKTMTRDFKRCYELLKKLKMNSSSKIFLLPVDPVKFNCPHYYTIVLNPMDLSTVEQKMIDGKYSTIQEWADDVNQIWANCKLFNKIGDWAYTCGLTMESFFKTKLKRLAVTPHFLSKNPYVKPEKTRKKKKKEKVSKKKKDPRGRKKKKVEGVSLPQYTQYPQDEVTSFVERRKLFDKICVLSSEQLAIVAKILQKGESKKKNSFRRKKFTLDLKAVSEGTIGILRYFTKYFHKKK